MPPAQRCPERTRGPGQWIAPGPSSPSSAHSQKSHASCGSKGSAGRGLPLPNVPNPGFHRGNVRHTPTSPGEEGKEVMPPTEPLPLVGQHGPHGDVLKQVGILRAHRASAHSQLHPKMTNSSLHLNFFVCCFISNKFVWNHDIGCHVWPVHSCKSPLSLSLRCEFSPMLFNLLQHTAAWGGDKVHNK